MKMISHKSSVTLTETILGPFKRTLSKLGGRLV